MEKKVIVTGQSGVDKEEYLERVASQKYVNKEERRKINLFHVGQMMYEEANKAGGKIQPGKILNLPLLRLSSLRRLVFKDVIHFSQKHLEENAIVNTHSCFRWRWGLFSAFDFDQIQAFDPDMYITLIDDVDAIYTRLKKRKDPHVTEFSLKDILVWREEEMITTEMIAMNQMKPFYVVPRKNPIDTIFKLMFKGNLKKAYLSFPITKVRDKPEIRRKIDDFKRLMAERIIIFDPITISEKRLLLGRPEEGTSGSLEIETLGEKIKFRISEIESIRNEIDGQIILRDFRLIFQSDMVVAFIPEVGGKADISAGVQTEMHYAHGLPREVYVIWEPKEDPSVWVEQMATKVFQGDKAFEECLTYFQKRGYIAHSSE